MKHAIRRFIHTNSDTFIVRILASISEKVIRASQNQDYWDLSENGEVWLIRKLAERANRPGFTVFDVGAFCGNYARTVRESIPEAYIYSFELIPETYERLAKAMANDPKAQAFPFGLSDKDASLTATYDPKHPNMSSLSLTVHPDLTDESRLLEVECHVRKGDDVVESLAPGHIDFLKVDVEGHEVAVLRGLEKTLSNPHAPSVVQFEYGTTFIGSRSFLKDVYDLLTPKGYMIGRLFPNRIEFREYSIAEENFRMGNYVAVKTDHPLFQILQNEAGAR